MTGMVVGVVADRGFGFVRPDDGSEDVFFHVRALRDLSLANNMEALRYRRVEYAVTVDPSTGKTRAADVCLMEAN